MAVFTIVWKDIVLELKTREVISSMLFFSFLVILIFNFAFDLDMRSDDLVNLAPGVLWVCFTFAGILGLNRSFLIEKEEGGITGLMLAPVDRSLIFIGKVLSNFLFMLIVEILSAVAFLVLFNFNTLYERALPLIVILLLGTLAFAVIGTLFSAITVNTKAREILLPLLFFPVLAPVVIAAVSSTGIVLRGGGLEKAAQWLKIMSVFDILFFAIGIAVFGYVLEE